VPPPLRISSRRSKEVAFISFIYRNLTDTPFGVYPPVAVSPRNKEHIMGKSILRFVARAAVSGGLREW
jgi:hypothetical protein